jgi:glycosyltransferase involved in cell wall biosynthesis
MSNQQVSVIIPAFNAGRFIAEAVDSVLAQTVPAAEVIVIDDGSTDDTQQCLRPYGDRITYTWQRNQGVAAARNHGLKRAQGDFVAFLDADDYWHPQKLELQLKAFSQNPSLGLLGTEVFDWPAADLPKPNDDGSFIVDVPWRNLVVRNCFTTSAVMIRRELLQRVGLFDTNLHGPEDYDFWLRLSEVAGSANLKRPLTGYRMVDGSLGKQARSMQAGMRLILKKLDARTAWAGNRRLRWKAHSYCDYSCAYMYRAARFRKRSLALLLRSVCVYPLAFDSGEVRTPFARPKMFGAICIDKLHESVPMLRTFLPRRRSECVQ